MIIKIHQIKENKWEYSINIFLRMNIEIINEAYLNL